MSENANGYTPTAADVPAGLFDRCEAHDNASAGWTIEVVEAPTWTIGNRPATPDENARMNANVAHGNASAGFSAK